MDQQPIAAEVIETGSGGQMLKGHRWLVRLLSDGSEHHVAITARIRTTKIPCLEVGQHVFVWIHPTGQVSIDVTRSNLDWRGPMKLARKIKRSKWK